MALKDQIEAQLARGVSDMSPLSGGDVAEAYRVTLDDGERVFAKTHRQAPPGFFSTEASGLAWLREPGAVPIPEVLAVSDDPAFLVLEWIEPGRAIGSTDRDFGFALAALHQSEAPCFGREDRRTTGSRRLPNEPCSSWSEHYRKNRLEPLADLAARENALPKGTLRLLEEVAARLQDFHPVEEAPARLHGDLWAGNRLVDAGGKSWLIDPAAHGGHREFDLAMMRLFGGYGDATFAAYHEAFPLAPGWERRVSLHQLAPLVVHAIKFGGGYAEATRQALTSLV